MKFENFSVARKLWMVVIPVLLILTGSSLWSQQLSSEAMETAMDDIARTQGHITTAVKWKGLTEANAQRVIAAALSNEPAVIDTFTGAIKAGTEAISAVQKSVVESATSEREKQALAKVAERRQKVLDIRKTLAAQKASGASEQVAATVNQQLLPAVSVYLQSLDEFIQVQEALRDEARASAVASGVQLQRMNLILVAVLLALSVGGVSLLARSISRPLEHAVTVAQTIAQGDLRSSLQTTRRDEVGLLLNAMGEMSERLRTVVSHVREGVETVSTASHQIASGNQDLSFRTEQTSANLQQTASSMEELTSTVSRTADTARLANQLATTAANAASRGGEVVNEVVNNMAMITASSKRISEIIGVIDGIAFQTNILALNAAVEAARAGEQGRGFAVVAGEVRSLAQRSASAAKEIKELIQSSAMTVESGAELVSQTGSAMGEIVASVKRMSDMISEIATASGEQSQGLMQVNASVTSLDQMTQQNSALVEESAAAAQSLRDQAHRLAGVVSVFKVDAGHAFA